MSVTVKEILQRVEEHDQPVLDFLMSDRNGETLIQLAKRFKRSRNDVKWSIGRLKAGGHIRKSISNYGKWYAVDCDFLEEVVAKRQNEESTQANLNV